MKELTLEAVTESIPKLTAFIDEELEAHDCGMKAQLQIDVAVDELFSNISFYAYAPGTGEATVQVDVDDDARLASITFIDRGEPFDPLARPDTDVKSRVREGEIGGLGIYLVRKTMDAVEYRREDGCNILTIRKTI